VFVLLDVVAKNLNPGVSSGRDDIQIPVTIDIPDT
jgi:hypothetical protein